MWARAVVLLLLVPACRPQYLDEEVAEEYKNADFYDSSDETEVTMPLLTTAAMDAYTRVRRFENRDEQRTLGPQELRDVRGALRDIFANRRIEAGAAAEFTKSSPSSHFEFSDKSTSLADTSAENKPSDERDNSYNQTDPSYEQSEDPSAFNITSDGPFDDSEIRDIKDILQLPTEDPTISSSTYTSQQYEWNSTEEEMPVYGKKEERSVLREAVRGLNSRVQTWQPLDPTNTILTTLLEYLDNSTERTLSQEEIKEVEGALERFISNQKYNTNAPINLKNTSLVTHQPFRTNHSTDPDETLLSTVTELYEIATTEDENETGDVNEYLENDVLRQDIKIRKKVKKKKKITKKVEVPIPSGMVVHGKWQTFPRGWPYSQTQCPTTDTTPFKMNVHGMMWLLANLTYEYDMQLVERFNESLYKYSVPTCQPPGRVTLGTTPFDVDNATVVAKCFVCGLKATHIPQDAYCADAFAGDFLPLVPVDPRARGHIARYRKYCRYADLRDSVEFPDRPRSVYGRFSAGCSVRWTDLSGVYTQRSCRNRRRAVTGNHFGSKRMAKLEMALNHLDNGCIISPMATLLPLSRGISLYARFHACVCTGAWCNRTALDAPWLVTIIFTFWIYNILKSL